MSKLQKRHFFWLISGSSIASILKGLSILPNLRKFIKICMKCTNISCVEIFCYTHILIPKSAIRPNLCYYRLIWHRWVFNSTILICHIIKSIQARVNYIKHQVTLQSYLMTIAKFHSYQKTQVTLSHGRTDATVTTFLSYLLHRHQSRDTPNTNSPTPR